MEARERWPERPAVVTTYDHHNTKLPSKQILYEFCDDSITNAFRFLNANDVEALLPLLLGTPSTSSTVHYEDNRSIVWIAANQEELYKNYPDQWILVEGEAVVAHSADPLELQEIADKRGITTAFMTRVAPPSIPSRSIYGQ